VLATPFAGILTFRWWERLSWAARAVFGVLAVIGAVAAFVWILAYANPFFSNA
jgi:hypothetical protein